MRRIVKGLGWVREWVQIRERNEAWDLWVYTLAAFGILEFLARRGGDSLERKLPEIAAFWSSPPEEAPPVEPVQPPPRRASWATAGLPWRNVGSGWPF